MIEQQDYQDVKQRFDLLCSIGKRIEATSATVDIKRRPEYFDEERFERAQRTIHKFYTSLQMASNAGLLLLIQFNCILIPLLKTGKSQSIVCLYERYSFTMKYIRKCYETKFYDESSDGWRYMMLVRGMHQRIFELMNREHGDLLKNEKSGHDETIVWVNQYDMALTQFAFVGLLVLEPNKCAAYSITQDEQLDIIYYWRLMSYYFGIEERFNIFVYDNDWPKQHRLMLTIMDELFRKELEQSRSAIGVEMAQGIMLSLEDLLEELTFNILDYWWSSYVSISGRKQLAPYTKLELYKLMRFLFIFKVLFKSPYLVARMNEKYKKKFDKFLANGEKIKKSLAKKYGHIKFEFSSDLGPDLQS